MKNRFTLMDPEMIHAGCWAHARRKFYEAHQLDPADAAAREVLERIGRLYVVEPQARAEKLTAVARQQRRAEQSAAEVTALKARLLTIRAANWPRRATTPCGSGTGWKFSSPTGRWRLTRT